MLLSPQNHKFSLQRASSVNSNLGLIKALFDPFLTKGEECCSYSSSFPSPSSSSYDWHRTFNCNRYFLILKHISLSITFSYCICSSSISRHYSMDLVAVSKLSIFLLDLLEYCEGCTRNAWGLVRLRVSCCLLTFWKLSSLMIGFVFI